MKTEGHLKNNSSLSFVDTNLNNLENQNLEYNSVGILQICQKIKAIQIEYDSTLPLGAALMESIFCASNIFEKTNVHNDNVLTARYYLC